MADSHLRPFTDYALEAVEEFLSPAKASVKYGIDPLDIRTGGARKREFTVIGARPKVGKTTALLNVAHNAAQHQQQRVALFSLEVASYSIALSQLIIWCKDVDALDKATRFDVASVRDRTAEAKEAAAMIKTYLPNPDAEDARPQIKWPDLWLCDDKLTVEAISRCVEEIKPDLVLVDYLQIVKPSDPKAVREKQVSDMAEGLRHIAKTQDCAVVATAQLNRGGVDENGDDNVPTGNMIRESDAVLMHANNVFLLHRLLKTDPTTMRIIVEVQRDGESGLEPFGVEFDGAHKWIGTTEKPIKAQEKPEPKEKKGRKSSW